MSAAADLITSIQENYGQEQAAKVIARLVRMPVVWQALLDSSLRQAAFRNGEISLSQLITEVDNSEHQELSGLIEKAKGIAGHQYSKADSDEATADETLLTIAVVISGEATCLNEALGSDELTIRRSAAHAYMNLLTLEPEMAPSLVELTSEEIYQLAMDAMMDTDRSMAASLVEHIEAEDQTSSQSFIQDSVNHWLNGEVETAQTLMEAAWDEITDQAADAADAIARLAADNGQPLIEVQAYERAIKIRATPRRRAMLALAKLNLDDPQGALESLHKDSQSPRELIALGLSYLALSQPNQAKEAFHKIDPNELPSDPTWERWLLQGVAELGDMNVAVRQLKTSIARHPADRSLRRLAAQICLKTGDSSNAVEHAALLTSIGPDDQEARLLLAEAYYANGQAELALPIWSDTAAESPEIKAKAVTAALETGDINAALRFSQELVEADPNSAKARLALGKSLIQAGNQPGGKLHIRRATELEPSHPEAWLELIQLQSDSTDTNEDLFTDAITACPGNPELLSAQADWLEAQGRLTEALAVSRQACELAEDEPELILQQANLLLTLEKPEEAKPLLEEVVRRQPANWPARIELASIQEMAGEIDPALATIESMPDDVDKTAHTLLARLIIKGGSGSNEARSKQALAAISKAKPEEGAGNPELEYWQARALQLGGRYEEALQRYQDCMKSLPEGDSERAQACLQGQAESAMASEQIPVAISILERARDKGDLDPSSLALLSKAYLTAGLADEAFEPAVAACEQSPQDIEIRRQYLAACKAIGAIDQALEKIDEWLGQNQSDHQLLFEKASLLIEQNQIGTARKAIAQLAWNSRHQPKELDEISQLLIEADQPSSAVRMLQNADYQEPDDSDRLAQLAEAAMAANQPKIAVGAWERVLAKEANNLTALLGAAQANWQLDQRMSAIGFWQRALGVEPERADLHAQLARAQLTNGETSQALSHFRSAVELAPEERTIRLEAAKALMANHNYAEALTLLSDSSKAEMAQDAVWLSLLAQLYLGLGRPQEALATVTRYSDQQPNAKLKALAALANGRTGQSDQAFSALEGALAIEPTDLDEATWIARAALELGRWQAAFDATSNVECADTVKKHQIQLDLEVGCRLADAYTLLMTLGSAVDHAPPAELVGQSAYRRLQKNLESLETAGVPSSEINAWRARLNTAFGREGNQGVPALQSLPSDHVIRQQSMEGLALAQLVAANPEDALRTLASAPESLQAGPWSPLIAGLAHLHLDRPAMARKAFGAVDKGNTLWPLAAFFVGKCWRHEGRPDEAINSWNTAVLAWPTEFRWQSELALIYRQQEKPEAALPHLQAALEASPENHDLRLPLARSLFELGELTEAVSQYQMVQPQFKDDPEVLTEIGHAFMATGMFEQAYEQFENALAINRQHVPAEVGAAQAAWHKGDKRQAEKHSTKAIQGNVRQPNLVLALSEMMISSGEADGAISLLDDAFGQSQLPADIARTKANALFELGRAQESIKLLRQVVDQDPEDDRSWATLAKVYGSANQAGQAIDALRIALNLRPGHRKYRMELAKLYRETGQLDQALNELTTMQNEDPQDPSVPMEIGLVHRARRQLRQALAAFKQSIALNKEGAAAYFQAGMVLKALKAYPQSVEMLEKAVSINPKDSEAMHQLAAVQALQLVHGGIQQSAVSG